jgi:hypothetical protein
MKITKKQLIDAIQAAVDAPAKSGTKWDSLEKLFADENLRGNGAINNGAGADRTTRVRQLATFKKHNGHSSQGVANHSVFVIGGGTVAAYKNNPDGYIKQIVQALKNDHPDFESCLVVVATQGAAVSPVCLIKKTGQKKQIPYEVWWPNLPVITLPSSAHSSGTAAKEPSSIFSLIGSNVIFFGPPGTGKSTEVKRRVGAATMLRTQFHPEYSHADLIGSYRPVVGSEIEPSDQVVGHDGISIMRPVNYFAFVPGPLTLALELAFSANEHVFMVIEEINRGDCAAIFGDVFQLLDRDDSGRSEFGISLRSELVAYFKAKGVDYDKAGDGHLYLPSNLSLLATMNTSDQSLYPMDSAFKRRWNWVACPINFDQLIAYTDGVRPFLNDGKGSWDWIGFLELINKSIVRDNMEDKQLGPWFIKPANDGLVPWDDFLNKCLFYLWHDVFKGEQFSDLSPFRNDGPEIFSEVQANIRDNGLAAGLKYDFLVPIAVPMDSFDNEAIQEPENLSEKSAQEQ